MNNNKPKVSILITSFTSGGAEKVISLLLKKMIDDFEVKLVLFYNEIHFPVPEEVETILLTTGESSQTFFKKIADLFKFYRQYKKLLVENDIDYSLSFLAFPNLINGLLSNKRRRFKTLLSERGFPSENTSSKVSYLVSKLFYPVLYNRCDRLFSNSEYINEDLKKNFGITIPMEVIYNPLEIPKKQVSPKNLDGSLDPIRIITVGSVDKRKNHRMVVKAMKTIGDTSLTFDIYGAGPLEDQLKKEIFDMGLNKQIFLKGRTKEVNKKLLAAHIFILSSHNEGFPNALMEAIAVGLPCISTNCLSGPLEMLNENEKVNIPNGSFVKAKYGILINTDDDMGLAKAIKFLKNNPEERENYSRLSLQRAKAYELDIVYPTFKNFLLKQ